MLTRLRFWWYLLDKGDLAFFAALACVFAVVAGIARFAYVDNAERRSALRRNAEINCLAENVYHEARGEPLAGQYAVAEVTVNRVASPFFPDSVCEVVHAQRFDPIRRRYVGAFSWTELGRLRSPRGQAWRNARAVATDVYDNPRDTPVVDGALYYHATYVSPTWAKTRVRVAQIGTHIFYE
jgi:spore germination cell wall hydrolase CwlJ-like protein